MQAGSSRNEILALAHSHGIAFLPTEPNTTGNALSQLSGEAVVLDTTELALLALQRAGIVTPEQADRLHLAYLTGRDP